MLRNLRTVLKPSSRAAARRLKETILQRVSGNEVMEITGNTREKLLAIDFPRTLPDNPVVAARNPVLQ